MERVVLGLLAASASLLLAGCGVCHAREAIGTGFDPDTLQELVVGRTTREEVIELLGPEYIQEESPDAIRFERITAEASVRAWGARCEAVREGVRIEFKDGVVSGYRALGDDRVTGIRMQE